MTQSLPPKKLVLYADDDPEDIDLIKEAFSRFSRDVELISFSNGRELLECMESLLPFEPAPCLIIIDINMPVLNGKETLKKLRSLKGFNDVPVVLFSTSTLPAEAAFAQQYNAGFVTKPLHQKQVHVILDQLIDHCTDDVKRTIRKRRE